MKKTLFLAGVLITIGFTSCSGEDDNGNNERTQLFCKCQDNPDSKECENLEKSEMERYKNAETEEQKAEIEQEWKEMEALCKNQ